MLFPGTVVTFSNVTFRRALPVILVLQGATFRCISCRFTHLVGPAIVALGSGSRVELLGCVFDDVAPGPVPSSNYEGILFFGSLLVNVPNTVAKHPSLHSTIVAENATVIVQDTQVFTVPPTPRSSAYGGYIYAIGSVIDIENSEFHGHHDGQLPLFHTESSSIQLRGVALYPPAGGALNVSCSTVLLMDTFVYAWAGPSYRGYHPVVIGRGSFLHVLDSVFKGPEEILGAVPSDLSAMELVHCETILEGSVFTGLNFPTNVIKATANATVGSCGLSSLLSIRQCLFSNCTTTWGTVWMSSGTGQVISLMTQYVNLTSANASGALVVRGKGTKLLSTEDYFLECRGYGGGCIGVSEVC